MYSDLYKNICRNTRNVNVIQELRGDNIQGETLTGILFG